MAEPVRAIDGEWVADGWEAWRAIPGEPDPRRCDDVLRAGEAFHRSVRGLPRPGFLDIRDDPWSYGDRVAWGELPVAGVSVMADLLMPLARARRPVDLLAQVVHGDLLGNVLFADTLLYADGTDERMAANSLAPAVIDWPVYFRPAPWALAVAVVDALTWHDVDAAVIGRWAGQDEWDQMLIRALLYRIATSDGRRRAGLPIRESAEDYRPVVDLVLARLTR